jgi:hypothetical protein
MEVLEAVDITWQRDFGGMSFLQNHKRGKTNDRGAGLES